MTRCMCTTNPMTAGTARSSVSSSSNPNCTLSLLRNSRGQRLTLSHAASSVCWPLTSSILWRLKWWFWTSTPDIILWERRTWCCGICSQTRTLTDGWPLKMTRRLFVFNYTIFVLSAIVSRVLSVSTAKCCLYSFLLIIFIATFPKSCQEVILNWLMFKCNFSISNLRKIKTCIDF